MEVRKLFGAIFGSKNTDSEKKIEAKKEPVETKKAQAYAQKATGAYGKAFVNLSFKKNSKQEKPFEERLEEFERELRSIVFAEDRIADVLRLINEDNITLATRLYTDVEINFPLYCIPDVLRYTNKDNSPLFERLLTDKKLDFPKDNIADVLHYINKDNSPLFEKLLTDKKLNFPKDNIADVLHYINKNNSPLFERLLTDKKLDFPTCEISRVLSALENADEEKIAFAQKLCTDKELDFSNGEISRVLSCTHAYNITLAKKLCGSKERDFSEHEIARILESTNKDNVTLIERLCTDKELGFSKNKVGNFLTCTYKDELSDKLALFEKLCNDKELAFSKDEIAIILVPKHKEAFPLIEKLCTDKELDFPACEIADVLRHVDKDNIEIAEKLCTDKEFDFPKDKIVSILILLKQADEDKKALFERLLTDKELDFPACEIADVLEALKSADEDKLALAEKLCTQYDKEEGIPINSIVAILKEEISQDEVRSLIKLMGRDKVSCLSSQDMLTASKLKGLYKKSDINEISLSRKRGVLRALVANNAASFTLSDELRKDFPLVPSNVEEYCSLLPSIVRSIGIETNNLNEAQIKELNEAVFNLSDELKGLSDEEFNGLEFEQEYSKDDFIQDTFNIVKDMKSNERQKVYDYFGFELKRNRANKTGFSITGYPVNLNNGKKLAEITDKKTKEIVEKLRPKVIEFSKNNKISCQNKNIEEALNKIVESFPEIRTEIGRSQHSTHSFDLFKHSMKVMQKVVQNPKFDKLNDSDKRLMLLASIFHDINKREGKRDLSHANEGAFDTFYITNKLDLSKEEKIKLYRLINSHEWLKDINRAKPENLEECKKSLAYDFQYNNLFDMANILTEADLKGVKADDSFYLKHRASMKENGDEIRDYIKELKKTMPMLPVTKFPKADVIEKAIKTVNPDGSTDIKGVYKDKSGLIVIKFNEVEDFKRIGFSKNCTNKGYEATASRKSQGKLQEKEVETGNIKFFVHALDYPNQLVKFGAFELPDSDALLSVSYAERPETKYRFFRPQGVLLDVDSDCVHGGGETDSGSGYGKNIKKFKTDYAYEGSKRHNDRKYIADLIKSALNLNDEEYVEFVNKNKNKEISEIKPKETREKLIKAYASISSNKRKGEREYNEMYASNPKIMGVFAYNENVGEKTDVNTFLEETKPQNGFLRDYALQNNLPFVILGD